MLIICEVCKKEFEVTKSRLKKNIMNGSRTCCSKHCALLGNSNAGKWQKEYYESSFESRFWSNVEKTDSCWNWTGGKTARGYGVCRKQRKKITAHRIAFFMHNPSVSQDLCVLHKCDNRLCVNPDHLFAGTQLDNVRDRDEKNRQIKGEQSIHAKLTNADVCRIKELLPLLTLGELATMFNVSKFSISSIKNGRTWKHLK